MKGLNFTAIDFETANSARASACSVGLARVVDGQVVEAASWLLSPPPGFEVFSPKNIEVHGITADMVVGAPTWDNILPRVMAFSGGNPFVAHNASFDGDVFQAVTLASGLTVPKTSFYCSQSLSEQQMVLDNYRLTTVASALGVAPFKHHDAAEDAAACAHIVLGIANQCQCHTLDGLWVDGPISIRAKASALPGPAPKQWAPSKKNSDLPQANPDADPTNPFYGHVFVFTGELTTMEREDAMANVAHYGGSNGINVTKKTTHLVAATTGTGKERKAQTYIDAGQPITIISEQQFLTMLDQVKNATALSTGVVSAAAPATIAAPAAPAMVPAREREAPAPVAENRIASAPPTLPSAAAADQEPAQVLVPARLTATAKRGTVLTDAMRNLSPQAHRKRGAQLLAISIVVGLLLAAIPAVGAILCLGSIGFGTYGNIVRRRTARTLEAEGSVGRRLGADKGLP